MNGEQKTDRMLDIFFRAIKGETLSVGSLANEYRTSTRSISRDISSLNLYLAEHRDTMGNAELVYDGKNRRYVLQMNDFISGMELLFILKTLMASRALGKESLQNLARKLKSHATPEDRKRLDRIIGKELQNYLEIKNDCPDTMKQVWELTGYIEKKQFITVTYIKMNRETVRHKIMPLSLIFSEFYFYLIACEVDDDTVSVPKYFRADRITHIVAHRDHYHLHASQEFDESLLRQRSLYMWPGPLRTIRFEFYGPSVQSILDKLPTARILKELPSGFLLEATVYGDGIKMFLLSQGSWVKVLSPESFVAEMKSEIEKISALY